MLPQWGEKQGWGRGGPGDLYCKEWPKNNGDVEMI